MSRRLNFWNVKQVEALPIKLLIAEDHPVVSDGVRAILSKAKDMVVVGQARDGASAIEMLKHLQPDIALLDLRMPIIDGIGVLRWLKNSKSSTGTIILSGFRSAHDVDGAFRAGANAYLLKDVSAVQLLKTIRRVHRSKSWISETMAREFAPNSKSDDLNASELRILALVIEGHANRTIGLKLGLDADAVKYRLRRVFSKLGVTKRAAAAREAIERNLMNQTGSQVASINGNGIP